MAREASALDLPLHPDLVLMAQRRRRLLRQADAPTAQARRVPLRRRTPRRHPALHRRAQPDRGKALRLDRGPRRHHCREKPRVPNVGINPLDRKKQGFDLKPLAYYTQ